MTKKDDIMWLESVDSTNNEAARRIADLDNLSVLSALSQTSGRGQRGNVWLSKPGENLTFSIVLKYRTSKEQSEKRPAMKAEDQLAISELTAVSVTELLYEYGIDAKIKWPNDIYVGDKKICGILIEHSVIGKFLSHSIIGVGININQDKFDSTLPNPASMKICMKTADKKGEDIDLNECLSKFMNIFKNNLRLLEEDRDYSRLHQRYIRRALQQ